MARFQSGQCNGLLCVASLLLGAALPGSAQTMIHLQTQGRAIDFANAPSTRPAKTGTVIPAVCTVGEVFFKTNASAGGNLYGCTATNTWTQLSTTGSATIAGDVTGNSSSSTVVALRNRTLSANTPSNGQVLAWNGPANTWEPQTLTSSGGGGGGGISLPFQTAITSATALSIGMGCSIASPCIARFGNTSYQFASTATATITGGSGTAYVYLNANGSLTVGHSMTLSCAGCTAESGVTSFPADSIPLYTWTASGGQWVSNGGSDWRSVISSNNVNPGVGMMASTVGGATTLSLDTAVVGIRVAVPATSTTACTSGYWAADAGYLYLCQSTNAWRRVALSSW